MQSSATLVALIVVGFVTQLSASPVWGKHRHSHHQDKIVDEGQPIELMCGNKSPYPPSFHWRFNGELIEQSPRDNIARDVLPVNIEHEESEVNTSFYIAHARPEHSGKYTCISHTMGNERPHKKSFNVVVRASTHAKKDVGIPKENTLRIYEWSVAAYQTEGLPMYVICRATQGTTKPSPTIKWTIGDEEVVESDNVKIHSNGDLEVKRTTDDFHFVAGPLNCTAISEDGHHVVKKTTFVYILRAENH